MSISKEQKRARIMMHVCVIIGFLGILLAILSLFDGKTYYLSPFGLFIAALQYYSYKQWQKKA